MQRSSQAKLFAPKLAAFTFWSGQLVILLAAISLTMGWTSSKQYAELEWPINILITIVWVSYAVVFLGAVISVLMKHEILEKNIGLLGLMMGLAVGIGGLTQIVPLFFQDVTNEPVAGLKPYTALHLEGRTPMPAMTASVTTRR